MTNYLDANIDGRSGKFPGARKFEYENQWDDHYGPRGVLPHETGTNPEPGFEEELPKGTHDAGLVTEYLDGNARVGVDTDQSLHSNA
jgi:hypothetical protein